MHDIKTDCKANQEVLEMQYIYMDHAATTPIDKYVLERMQPYFQERFGNASSRHYLGLVSSDAILLARSQVADTLNVQPGEIVFTSGGTEADNLAILGVALACRARGRHLITTTIEHPAVKSAFELLEQHGFTVTWLPVSKNGRISPEDVGAAIRPDTILVSVMFANNELGTIQPIQEIGAITRAHGVFFHTDAVQAFGSVPIQPRKMHIDLLSLSGHKIYGPKGSGALYIREGVPIESILYGGQQEAGKRAGTENVPAIVGLGAAADLMYTNLQARTAAVRSLRNDFEQRVLYEIPNVRVNGADSSRLSGHSSLTFLGINAKQIISKLNDRGIFASAGSACSCLTNMHSYVLRAIGLTDSEIEGTIRFSLGKENTVSDIDRVVHALKNAVLECREAN